MIRSLAPRLVAAVLVASVSFAEAAGAVTVIRDEEVEGAIAGIADPIFRAAGLDRDAIDVYILRDDKLNAFVAGGQNLFLNTGLIIRTETPGQLAGVIAHETGHIAGGHLTRAGQARERAGMESLVGMLLGAAAAVAGAPAVGTAIMAGGATVAQRGFLTFSRQQEQAADTAAVGFLAATGQSPRGLVEFFEHMRSQNLGISADGSEFLRTHPLTTSRIEFLEQKVASSRFRDARAAPELVEAHARMVAKLDAYLGEPAAVLERYPGDRTVDRYAQAVAYYRDGNSRAALGRLDELTAREPENPFFRELEGQILFETGRVAEAEAPYREAMRLKPRAPLIRIGLARSLIEQGGPGELAEARALLREVVRLEPRDPGAWRMLGIAEGRLGGEGRAALALTEEAVLLRRKDDAELQLARAESLLDVNDPEWVRLQDLQREVEELEEPPRQPRRR